MELIDQHTKKIMEGCKERAQSNGLKFQDESLEYIVTNRDLLDLSPKYMIPTLYDYWVHDVEVLKERGKYELYPSNPYETVINTRPAISFYNDNNPDWLNVMIFYHVLAHIDFFQNNLYFRHTWDYDFSGEALSDKRVIAKLRAEKGHWVDYIIEFTRGIDNLVGFHTELSKMYQAPTARISHRTDYYFDIFLQSVRGVKTNEYIKEIERYNQCANANTTLCQDLFFAEVDRKYPEFKTMYNKYLEAKPRRQNKDILQFITENSEFLNKEENKWMLIIIQIIRKTSLFFQPQIRTKIMNEGWASYWHETLFLKDDRIKGHEVEFARVNAGVTAMPRIGLNPYALGMKLFYYIEEMANKGKYSFKFQQIKDSQQRKMFDDHKNEGRDFIFKIREDYCDFIFINSFVDQDFVTNNDLFVAGKRLNEQRMVWEYYVKSRSSDDYKDMLLNQLYHPPTIFIDHSKAKENELYLIHQFEDKPLLKEFIPNTMLGLEYLWGAPVKLETHEAYVKTTRPAAPVIPGVPSQQTEKPQKKEIKWQHVLYTMKNKKLSKVTLQR